MTHERNKPVRAKLTLVQSEPLSDSETQGILDLGFEMTSAKDGKTRFVLSIDALVDGSGFISLTKQQIEIIKGLDRVPRPSKESQFRIAYFTLDSDGVSAGASFRPELLRVLSDQEVTLSFEVFSL